MHPRCSPACGRRAGGRAARLLRPALRGRDGVGEARGAEQEAVPESCGGPRGGPAAARQLATRPGRPAAGVGGREHPAPRVASGARSPPPPATSPASGPRCGCRRAGKEGGRRWRAPQGVCAVLCTPRAAAGRGARRGARVSGVPSFPLPWLGGVRLVSRWG